MRRQAEHVTGFLCLPCGEQYNLRDKLDTDHIESVRATGGHGKGVGRGGGILRECSGNSFQ